jgi:hypothetical protein
MSYKEYSNPIYQRSTAPMVPSKAFEGDEKAPLIMDSSDSIQVEERNKKRSSKEDKNKNFCQRHLKKLIGLGVCLVLLAVLLVVVLPLGIKGPFFLPINSRDFDVFNFLLFFFSFNGKVSEGSRHHHRGNGGH